MQILYSVGPLRAYRRGSSRGTHDPSVLSTPSRASLESRHLGWRIPHPPIGSGAKSQGCSKAARHFFAPHQAVAERIRKYCRGKNGRCGPCSNPGRRRAVSRPRATREASQEASLRVFRGCRSGGSRSGPCRRLMWHDRSEPHFSIVIFLAPVNPERTYLTRVK